MLLLIEVADASLQYDRGAKLEAYARAAIPEYWIVNLVDVQLEIYREPSGSAFKTTLIHRRDEHAVSPLALPSAKISAAELFAKL